MGRKHRPIILEVHARNRMAARGITEDQVFQTIRKAHASYVQRANGRRVFEREFSVRKRLKVITEDGDDLIRVVTAWWV